jgi:acetate kinase
VPNAEERSTAAGGSVLTLNGGSSSIKLAVYGGAAGGAQGGESGGDPDARLLEGKVERIGSPGTVLRLSAPRGSGRPYALEEEVPAGASVVDFLVERLAAWDEAEEMADIGAVGHRVVHGLHHTAPERITPALLAELRALSPYSPEHMPLEIALIEAFERRFPAVPQVACFDTAFHRSMPRVARLLPLPRRLDARGVQRYGFHGLSYAYLLEELARLAGPEAARGRVIFAHLGNGASLAAVRDGRSVDTSMGFTPTAGIPMGTRSGDLDPGLLTYLEQTEG